MVVSLGGEWCTQERWVAPHRILPTDEHVVTGVDWECRNVFYKAVNLIFLWQNLCNDLSLSLLSFVTNPLAPTSNAQTCGFSTVMSSRKYAYLFSLWVCENRKFSSRSKLTVNSKMKRSPDRRSIMTMSGRHAGPRKNLIQQVRRMMTPHHTCINKCVNLRMVLRIFCGASSQNYKVKWWEHFFAADLLKLWQKSPF